LTIISTIENPIVPFQNKIHYTVQKLIESIHPDFYLTKPILSGSFLIKLLIDPKAYFSDYDFYFESQEKYNEAKTMLLETHPLVYSNLNCHTFDLNNSGLHLQIISTYFGDPSSIIANHDIENSKLSYQGTSLFFTKKFLEVWIEGKLSLDTFQVENLKTPKAKYFSFLSTLSRIKKYLTRYNLELDQKTISMLFEVKNHFKENKDLYKEFKKTTNSIALPYGSFKGELDSYHSVILFLDSLLEPNVLHFPEPIEF
jgi:hypothetical protein